jgi:hypothetical protein
MHEDGSLELTDYKFKYSNSPNENWFGTYKFEGQGKFTLEEGRYDWFGWGRESSGKLIMELREVKPGDNLEEGRSGWFG